MYKFRVLCFQRNLNKIEKKTTHFVGERLSEKGDFWMLQFSSVILEFHFNEFVAHDWANGLAEKIRSPLKIVA